AALVYTCVRFATAFGLKIPSQPLRCRTSYSLEPEVVLVLTIALLRCEWKGEIDLARNRNLRLVVIRSCDVSWLLCLGSEGPVLVGIACPDGYNLFIFFRFTRWT